MPDDHGKQRGPARQPRPACPPCPPRPATSGDAAVRVIDAMTDLLDLVAREQGFADLDPAILDGVTIPVGHGLSGQSVARGASQTLAARAAEIVRTAATGTDNWRSGFMYCLQCDSADCAHALPPGPADVFAGYLPTGKPSWVDFTHFCMDRHVEGFETLFVERPGVVGVAIPGAELNSDLLDSFNDATYRVVYAVDAGLIPVDFEPVRPGQERFAMSLVAVAVVKGVSPVIRLNPVGLDIEALDNAAGNQGLRGPAERIRKIIAATRARLDAVSLALRHDVKVSSTSDMAAISARLESQVGPVMNRLRSDVVAVFQGVDDRTRHGEHRSRSGERPTSAAFGDALGATDERLFFDVSEKTVVVSGPRGRCHVFTRDGRLVTSITLAPGEMDARLSRGRWRPLEQSAIVQFRQAISRRRCQD